MTYPGSELKAKLDAVRSGWKTYQSSQGFAQFVEFAVTLPSLVGFLSAKGLLGIHSLAYELEQYALSLFGSDETHPLASAEQQRICQFLSDLEARIAALRESVTPTDRRTALVIQSEAAPPATERRVLFVGQQVQAWADMLGQLGYFGLRVDVCDASNLDSVIGEPTQVLVDMAMDEEAAGLSLLRQLRQRFALSTLHALNIAAGFTSMHAALAAGCNDGFVHGTNTALIMARILDNSVTDANETCRVLIVEDSKTAAASIKRSLSNDGIESRAIHDPQQVLKELHAYQPDLILMDMHMPGCNGVEAARVIRQFPQFLSTPIVFLSGETDIARQIDALRLGVDHFLTKPVNPVILNAIVRTKIDRYRDLRRTMSNDSLTGLLNHTTSKQKLDGVLRTAASSNAPMAVAMVDIDHFKKVNDSYGHPMGDQIIRSLAWLLKQRLRNTDVLGRYGGEEFIVGLPGAAPDKAVDILDAIRHDFGQIRHLADDTWFNTTFSCGVAHFPHTVDRESLVKAADEALYEAKRNGRNCVVSNLTG